jgi:hypothetical protein
MELRDIPDLIPAFRRRAAEDTDAPGCEWEETEDCLEEGGLPAAVWPDNGGKIMLFHLPGDISMATCLP